jgi:hypothetical protein
MLDRIVPQYNAIGTVPGMSRDAAGRASSCPSGTAFAASAAAPASRVVRGLSALERKRPSRVRSVYRFALDDDACGTHHRNQVLAGQWSGAQSLALTRQWSARHFPNDHAHFTTLLPCPMLICSQLVRVDTLSLAGRTVNRQILCVHPFVSAVRPADAFPPYDHMKMLRQ